MDYALPLHVEGLGLDSCQVRLFSFFFVVVLFCFVSFLKKTILSFCLFSFVRPTQIYGIFKKKSNDVVKPFFT